MNVKSPTQVFLALVLLIGAHIARPGIAHAQDVKSCPDLLKNAHKTFECVEGIFSEDPVHGTFSSIPPGNGFPLGIVYEDAVHHVGEYKSLTDPTLALVGSTNGSWYTTGSLIWLPPVPYTDTSRNGASCHKLGPLCTKEVFGINVYGTHRNLNSLSFFGLGNTPAGTQYNFKEKDTYGGITLRMPITNWLGVDGQIEGRAPSLPSTSASNSVNVNFAEATAPGLVDQPIFLHSAVSIRTNATRIAERATNPLAAVATAPMPLMKGRTVFRFENNAGYHWYQDTRTGLYSFQQMVFDGNESIQFGSVLQRFVEPGTSWIVSHLCDGNKVDDTCDFGTLYVKSWFSFANVGATHTMPFYFQPTIGGSDIDSRESLRAFDNYRFRDRNAAVVQLEIARTIKDPLGAFLFYDGGMVGRVVSDLSSSPFRQDGGVGVSLRLNGNVVARGFLAAGAGDGVKFGYNFSKFF